MKFHDHYYIFHDLFEYCEETGFLYYKPRSWERKEWNSRHAGARAGCIHKTKNFGYIRLHIKAKGLNLRIMAHTVIWVMKTGRYPDGEIDHIDGYGVNNIFSNLRDVDTASNMHNKCKSKNNTSGVTGVSWYKNTGKWVACFRKYRVHHFVGYFDDFDDACEAIRKARLDSGFHEGHGKDKPYA